MIVQNSIAGGFRAFVESLKQGQCQALKTDAARIFASLLAKRLLIITGLSGSGKSLISQVLVKWMEGAAGGDEYQLLSRVLSSPEFLQRYTVVSFSRTYTEVVNKNGDSGKIIPLPTPAIIEWYNAVRKMDYGAIDPKEFKHVVGEQSNYQKHIHGFYTEFFRLAVQMCERAKASEPSVSARPGDKAVFVSIGADWTSNENLLGYPDALKERSYRKPDNGALDLILRAKEDHECPYFLILDEMNLSHVERYFADFLSAMESCEPIYLHDDTGADWDGVPAKLMIPDNLFVIGTVNVDETTYMFSPKVLDRANVIEFRVSRDEMDAFLKNPIKPDLDKIAGQGAQYANAFVAAAREKNLALDEELRGKISEVLLEFFPQLQEAGAEFGYRTAHEICRFVYFHRKLSGEGWEFHAAMDVAIMQKLMPKLHGSKKKLGPVLEKLERLCAGRFTSSLEKIGRMRKRLAEHGFTSFAEA